MPDKKPTPKYRHYRPKNLGVIRLDGRDIYLGRYNSPESWEKYGRAVAEWRARGRSNPCTWTASDASPPDSPWINEVILAFCDRHADHYRASDGTPSGEFDNYRDSLRPLR